MALINCEECGKEISDTANKCIHCGVPLITNNNVNRTDNDMSAKKETKKILNIIIIICLSLFTIYTLYNLYENLKYIFSLETLTYSSIKEEIYYILYYITTAIYFPISSFILWFIYFDNNSKTNVFKIINGIIILVETIIWLLFILFYIVIAKDNWFSGVLYDFMSNYAILIICYLMSIRRK